jgi:hypothetical protein
MTAPAARSDFTVPAIDPGRFALIWIDAREASIVRASDGQPSIERVRSDVPAHRRGTGHQEHNPTSGDGGEPHRLEHLARFLRAVGHHLPPDADLLVVGPGTVRWRLVASLRDQDARRGVHRVIRSAAAPRWTNGQLLAEFRQATGAPQRRRTLGASRWIGLHGRPLGRRASAHPTRHPTKRSP